MPRTRLTTFTLACLTAAVTTVGGGGAHPAAADDGIELLRDATGDYVDDELVLRLRGGRERVVSVGEEASVPQLAAIVARDPDVAYATPNYIARAAGIANDPGGTGRVGGWRLRQWNFLPCGSICDPTGHKFKHQARGGIGAERAWKTLIKRGRPFGRGVKVAVVDTGVAYVTRKPTLRRSPDFSRRQFLRGADFVERDQIAQDEDGHGTHVAGTIAERTGNGRALTGLVPGAKIIPVRVLDANGIGTAREIAMGIRFAAKRGARVINLSFEFSSGITTCRPIQGVCNAIAFAANRHGAVVVAAAGNSDGDQVAYPSAAPRVISVGRTTKDACVAAGSRGGSSLDIVAPGGGPPASPDCVADGTPFGRSSPILQLTFRGNNLRRFGYPKFYEGTSMAAAHVSGVAAMVIAARVLGKRPRPWLVECQLEQTARSGLGELGEPYDPERHGAGLLDAAAAVAGRAPGC